MDNVGLMGRSGAGKDTVAEYLIREYGYTRVSFADRVREMALRLDPIIAGEEERADEGLGPVRLTELVRVVGWNAAKAVPEVRRLLQRLGTDCVRCMIGADTWVDLAIHEINVTRGPVVVTDVRFGNEVAALRVRGFDLIYIERPDSAGVVPHVSETAVGPSDADYTLVNDRTPAAIGERVAQIAQGMG